MQPQNKANNLLHVPILSFTFCQEQNAYFVKHKMPCKNQKKLIAKGFIDLLKHLDVTF